VSDCRHLAYDWIARYRESRLYRHRRVRSGSPLLQLSIPEAAALGTALCLSGVHRRKIWRRSGRPGTRRNRCDDRVGAPLISPPAGQERQVHSSPSTYRRKPYPGRRRPNRGDGRLRQDLPLHDQTAQVWQQLVGGRRLSLADTGRHMLAYVNAYRTCREAVDQLCCLAGAAAIFSTSAVDLLLRDMHTMAQHVLAGPRSLEMAGGLFLGAEPVRMIILWPGQM
jgi:hypothetical protein